MASSDNWFQEGNTLPQLGLSAEEARVRMITAKAEAAAPGAVGNGAVAGIKGATSKGVSAVSGALSAVTPTRILPKSWHDPNVKAMNSPEMVEKVESIANALRRHLFELVVGLLSCVPTTRPQLAMVLDTAAASRNLKVLASAMRSLWLAMPSDAFSENWTDEQQEEWLLRIFLVDNGNDQTDASIMNSYTCLTLLHSTLSDFEQAIVHGIKSWDAATKGAWEKKVQRISATIQQTYGASSQVAPSYITFPAMAYVQRVVFRPDAVQGDHGTATRAPVFYQICSEKESGTEALRVCASDVLQALAAGTAELASVSDSNNCGDDSSTTPAPKIQDLQTMAACGGLKQGLFEESKAAASRIFASKMRPITLVNRAQEPLKGVLYNLADKLCMIPAGGVGGPGVLRLEPSRQGKMEMPPGEDTFLLKVFRPGLIDRALYLGEVSRGQTIQLKTDCFIIEGRR
eukprot:CAMPEP_0204320868 /NCGR_PEP_ID=MMETSP0469-20131031/7856_1 /ASSEMBLY_ACC=CAM_ASM_000384 /TAXON_ID=2969 /ORGANISM="Oxyrrhis marina" /LENGTH=458 /DNA_ID=CAMNT_0051302133 /DNA_START=49 /DNA_END=1425 /DNA_ORIENTATION=-